MAYSTYAQIVDTYGLPLITRLASRRDDHSPLDVAVVTTRVTAALEEASGFMDGFFQMVHAVPVQTTVASGISLLRSCCEQLAIAFLVVHRGYIRNSEDESLVLAQDRWRSFLQRVADGKATIPGIGESDLSGLGSQPSQGFYVSSEEPFFPPASNFV